MTKKFEIYKCEDCGDMLEVVREGQGTFSCCDKPLKLLVENTVDASREKHVPVVERLASGIKVKVGSAPHPMEAKHWIEWIEVIAGGTACRQYLKPGDAPEAVFNITANEIAVREHCNLHGLWKS
jgi:superoxide reductase